MTEELALFEQLVAFVERLMLIDYLVIGINLLLIVFSRRILMFFRRTKEIDNRFRINLMMFRGLSVLVIVAFGYYHVYLPADSQDWGIKLLASAVVIFLAFGFQNVASYFIQLRYGKTVTFRGEAFHTETYYSRIFRILSATLIFVITLITVIRILGFGSLLEAGGALGVIGVMIALTQSTWAPDLFSGLIILHNRMIDPGDVIELDGSERTLGIVHKVKLFHTEIRNLVNNHRIMIKNAYLRDHIIHNLSKFASSNGLRELLRFKIGYDVEPKKLKAMFEIAFKHALHDEQVKLEEHPGIEIRMLDAGDFAVEWGVFYYTKEVDQILKTRQLFREVILETAMAQGISLGTPMQHQILPYEQPQPEKPTHVDEQEAHAAKPV